MKQPFSRKLQGTSEYARAFNSVVDIMRSIAPCIPPVPGSLGQMTTQGPHGTMIRPNGQLFRAAQAGGSSATRMRVKKVYGDYYICRTWDGTTEGGSDIAVAKPPELRHALVSEIIEAVTVSYSYVARADNYDGWDTGSATYKGERHAAASGRTTQVEIILPVYHINAASDDYSEIWADKPVGGTGVGAAPTWMDTNRAGRVWGMVGTL